MLPYNPTGEKRAENISKLVHTNTLTSIKNKLTRKYSGACWYRNHHAFKRADKEYKFLDCIIFCYLTAI